MWLTALLRRREILKWVQKRAITDDKKEVPFFLSFPPSEQRRKRPFYDSSCCHNAIIPCLTHFTCTHFFSFLPSPPSLLPTQSPIISIQCHCDLLLAYGLVKKTDWEKRSNMHRQAEMLFDVKWQLKWRDELQTYSKFIEMYTRKNIFVWNESWIYERTVTLRL